MWQVCQARVFFLLDCVARSRTCVQFFFPAGVVYVMYCAKIFWCINEIPEFKVRSIYVKKKKNNVRFFKRRKKDEQLTFFEKKKPKK